MSVRCRSDYAEKMCDNTTYIIIACTAYFLLVACLLNEGMSTAHNNNQHSIFVVFFSSKLALQCSTYHTSCLLAAVSFITLKTSARIHIQNRHTHNADQHRANRWQRSHGGRRRRAAGRAVRPAAARAGERVLVHADTSADALLQC